MKDVVYVNPPENCDVCGFAVGSEFVDGKTLQGSWANMCVSCFQKMGVGLGEGLGQWYQRQGNEFVKIRG